MRAIILGSRDSARRISTTDHNQPHHEPDATPTRSRPSKPALRPPLQSTDSNAKMRVPPKAPLGAKNNNKNMPYDKQQNTVSRPLMPTLSAAAKTTNRTPLTPRVAGSVPPTSTSPLARRGARIETTVASPREDISTPVSAFLNNNITPRSGSRKSRVDSNNTTPTGTPNGTPVLASSSDAFRSFQDAPAYGPGLGIMGIDKDIPKRPTGPTVTFSPSVSDVGRSAAPSSGGDSKFFFASDAKAVPSRPPIQTKNLSTFVYASGEAIPTPPHSSGASAVGSTIGEDKSKPRFFHANGAPDVPSHTAHLPSRPSSSLSNTSRMTSTRLGSQNPNVSFSPPPHPRPVSPSKLNQYATISSIRNSSALPSTESPRPLTSGKGVPTNIVATARRASIGTNSRVASHERSSSSSSSGMQSPTSRNVSGGSSVDVPITSPLSLITTSAPVSTPEEAADESTKKEVEPQSPIKAGHTLEQLNELAANARRERKVLDLEITNSSLAAINRTLEREMRKQTAELRRYRRLSRSGRLSIATTASMRTSTGTLSVIGEDGAALSDMSEGEEEEDEETELSDEELSDEASLSPGAMAESDLRHRKRDEKRLQLDLTKHQQLLIDSQKMNQSLKRCLGLTEALIGEGKKALDYKVRVSDVELGGRVLSPDEEGEEMDHEGMSEIGAQMLREARQAAANGTAAWSSIGKDDRDSGIEIDSKSKDGMAAERL